MCDCPNWQKFLAECFNSEADHVFLSGLLAKALGDDVDHP